MDAKAQKKTYWIHVAIVAIFMFGFRFIPAPAPITSYGMQILGIFIGLVYGWSCCELAWPSVLALVALGMTEFGITEAVFSSVFGQANLILMILGFMVFASLSASGLTEYLGNKLLAIRFMRGRPLVMIATIYFGVFVVCLTGINGYLMMFFMMGIFVDLFKNLGYQKGDRFIPMFLCGLFIQTSFANLFFPFMPMPIMVYGAAGIRVDTISYMLFAFVFILCLDVVYVLSFKFLRLNLEPLRELDYSKMEAKAKQKLSTYQKALLFVIILFIALMVIVGIFASADGNLFQQILNKLGVYGVIALILAILLVVRVEQKPLLSMETLTSGVNWNIVLLYAMALTMSNVLTSKETGISTFVVGIASPILATLSEYWFLLFIGAITLCLTNIGNNVVVIFTMVTVVKMMLDAGLPINGPLAVGVILFSGLSTGYLLPSASVSASLIYGCDMTTSKSSVIQGVTIMILWMIMLAIIMIPAGLLFF